MEVEIFMGWDLYEQNVFLVPLSNSNEFFATFSKKEKEKKPV